MTWWYLGLDLGQAQDFSALAILERKDRPPIELREPGRDPQSGLPSTIVRMKRQEPVYECRHLWRKRGVPYPDVVKHVKELLARPELTGRTELVVDGTGCGRPVIDMLWAEKLKPIPIGIHGGDRPSFDGWWKVPKRDLVGAVTVLMQSDRLRFAKDHPLTPTLRDELQNFRVEINAITAHDTYSAWREGEHDDLVLAVAIAAWWANRHKPPAQFRPSTYSVAPY